MNKSDRKVTDFMKLGSVVSLLCVNRVFIAVLGIVSHRIVQDYDLSAPTTAFIKWDAVYFVNIAKNGYNFEDQFAFYPGFPLLIRFVSKITGLSIETTSLLIPSVCYIFAGILLYLVTIEVGFPEKFAYRVSLFWSISPISIFCIAPYTESLFALLSFAGMLFWLRRKHIPALLCFIYASSVRSNGFILAGFFLYSGLLELVKLGNSGTSIYHSLIDFTVSITPRGLFKAAAFLSAALLCALPTVSLSHYANALMCPGCEWCGSSPYSYIQSKYWGVGFLTFWRPEQLPNIILALPIAIFVFKFAKIPPKNPVLLPFIVHAVFLLVFSLLFAHVHVTTRLLLAASPAAWWALAAHRGRAGIVFSVAFSVIGTISFTNFLPWC